ncbi:hypothetical protein ACM66B_004801 [Microbotryomycetes sp. NB124-2]
MSQPMFEFRRRSSTARVGLAGHVKVELEPLFKPGERSTASSNDSLTLEWNKGQVRRLLWLCTCAGTIVFVVLVLTVSGRDGRRQRLDGGGGGGLRPVLQGIMQGNRKKGFGNIGVPQWHDFDRIQRRVKSYRGVVRQTRLRHLADHRVQDPFEEVYVTSAWIDTRTLVVSATRNEQLAQLVLIASIQGREHMSMPSGLFQHNALKCYIVMRDSKTGSETVSIEHSQLQGLPDPHEWEVDLVSVKFSCPVKGDWQGADIYATLSTTDISPPTDSFVPVTALPLLDSAQHTTGKGSAAVCLPALVGDLYAPYLSDFVAYYRTLGFTQIYTYLLDPGPHSLEVLQKLGQEVGVTPVRFGLHKNVKTNMRDDQSTFAVPPSDWSISGIDVLEGDDEFELAGLAKGGAAQERSVRTWYFGQGLALHDCQYRAMKDGHRWMVSLDWDEFLALKLGNESDERAWPGLDEAERGGEVALHQWMRQARARWTWPFTLAWQEAVDGFGIDVANISQRNMPPAFMFQSTFACIKCTPRRDVVPDSTSPSVRAMTDLVPRIAQSGWTEPGAGLMLPMMSPVRMKDWFPQNFRSKTIVDPWAWWSLGIHGPGVGFAEWMVQRGPCSSTVSSEAALCAKDLVTAFGWGTALVATPDTAPPSPSDDVAKFGTSSSSLSNVSSSGQHSATGGLYHFRIDPQMSRAMIRLFSESQSSLQSSWPLDVLDGRTSVELVSNSRVKFEDSGRTQYGDDEIQLVQDWTMFETMGRALVPLLRAKREFGATEWIAKSGGGGAGVLRLEEKSVPSENVARLRKYALIGLLWLVTLWLLLARVWRWRRVAVPPRADQAKR